MRRSLLLGGLLVLLVLVWGVMRSQDHQLPKWLITASREELVQYVNAHPEQTDATAELAHRYLLAGSTTEANSLIEQALKVSPDSPSALRVRGDVQFALHQLTIAERDYRKSLSLQDDTRTRLALARTLIPLQRYAEISDLCAPVIALGSSSDISAEQRAQALVYTAGGKLYSPLTPQELSTLQAQLKEADSLSNALPREERFLPPYFLGESYLRLAQPKEAIPYLEKSTALAPTFAGSLYSLSRAYRLSGDTVKADTTSAKHTRLSRLMGELEAYSNRITQNSNDFEAMLKLAGTFAELGDKAQAADLYQRLIQMGKYVDVAAQKRKSLE